MSEAVRRYERRSVNIGEPRSVQCAPQRLIEAACAHRTATLSGPDMSTGAPVAAVCGTSPTIGATQRESIGDRHGTCPTTLSRLFKEDG
jgi:hypothetical protein